MWNKKELETLAEKYAKESNIDTDLVYSIISVESGWNVYAMRYEPTYKWLYYPRVFAEKLAITEFTEEHLQKFSYGIMQLMGAVCREYGFEKELVKMIEPENNLIIGCKFIKKLFDKYGNENDVISAYNQGSNKKTETGSYKNQLYCDKVHSFLRNYRRLN